MLDPDRLVGDVANLVSLPEVVVRINSLVDDPKSTADDIGRAVAQDPALTAKLLRIANSAMFGLTRQVETITRAVTVLGTRQIRDLTLGLSAAHAFDGIPNELVSPASFWHHSVLAATCGRLVASECVGGRRENAFVAGLLHDIGQLVLFAKAPEDSYRALEMTIDLPGEPELWVCEREVFGTDHAAVGGALARRWQLPVSLQECIEFHHEPQRASEYPVDVAVTHIANIVAQLVEIESTDLSDVPAIDPMALEVTGFTAAHVEDICAQARDAAADVKNMMQLPELH
jgi:putative nucleotidyltransferase with HDIG domain